MRTTILLLLIVVSCNSVSQFVSDDDKTDMIHYDHVGDIPVPDGFMRVEGVDSFAVWLRSVKLKKDRTVHLYNGELKRNQQAQFAVLDIPVGKKDLQQCADAVMRLRAEYLFSMRRYDEIRFEDNEGKRYQWTQGADKSSFENYLEQVFSWCGTLSLERSLHKIAMNDIQPGDVFIKGGSPGHAMIVVDVVQNEKGDKKFMLAQSYMPAQDIHIVRNPEKYNDPWYELNDDANIITPEWTFHSGQLRRW